MRRKLHALTALAALLGGTVLLLAPSAGAQTGYPPAACTVTNGSQFAGDHSVGESFTIRVVAVCSFTPGATASVTVNGQSVGTKTIEADGSVIINVVVQSADVLVINDPVSVPGNCGQNSAVVTGPASAANTNVTQTATFNVVCPGAGPARAVRGSVAFTGANLAKWSAIALAVIGLGAVLIMAARRRGQARG